MSIKSSSNINLRVVFCAYDTADGSIGGPITWAMDFIEYLYSIGVNTRVLVLRSGGEQGSRIKEFCEAKRIPISVLDTSVTTYIESQTEWILGECRSFCPSVFVANLVLPAMYAGRWLKELGIATIGVIHSNPDYDLFYRNVIDVFVGGGEKYRLTAAVSVSTYINGTVREKNNFLRAEVIPCGTKLTQHRAEVPNQNLKLIYAGRLVEKQKKIHATIEALVKACKIPGVTASVIGDGDQRKWVEKRLANETSVQYLGQVPPSQIHSVLSEHHVIVLLSESEGLPIALLEGMACGLVPISLEEPSGSNEIIENYSNGLSVKDRGEDFCKAVRYLFNPVRWQNMSNAALHTVRMQYSHEITFDKWKSLIVDLANDTDVTSHRLPGRVDLREFSTYFPGYSGNRRTRLEEFRYILNDCWYRIRQIIRPRKRLRRLLRID